MLNKQPATMARKPSSRGAKASVGQAGAATPARPRTGSEALEIGLKEGAASAALWGGAFITPEAVLPAGYPPPRAPPASAAWPAHPDRSGTDFSQTRKIASAIAAGVGALMSHPGD